MNQAPTYDVSNQHWVIKTTQTKRPPWALGSTWTMTK